ncbi:hypothetical protein RD792_003717 [Penstemon davidsonii]|uniref:AAA+ ATPase domain-containing protein n=1 Tax=Penstemon davidsonii TaxID=160366 RepID=A0ABR0DGK9_9LAMI|nr:hypothetical protein RD792_003717 [Penstemon davidsonii]
MEIVGAVASIIQCLCGDCCSNELISKKCSHLRNPQAVVQLLKDKIKLLNAREADLKTKLHEEELRRGGEPTSELNLWLDNVQKLKVVQASVEEKIQEKNSQLCGCFPNYYRRLKLGNYVTRKMHEVDNLLEQNIFSGNPLVNMSLKRGSFLPTTAIVGQTAKRILRKTWEYIIDNNTGIIGVYGMGGVGKTTLVKEINNDLLRDNTHFDDVIWVTASKDSNALKLQKDIAKELGLSFNDEDSEMTRARNLFENLMRRGRFLLIIDDLWEAFSLENVGIPIPTNTNGCKLLITTRLLMVCRSMETTGEIEVHVLPEEEAWGLFKEKVGEEVFSSPKIMDLAKRVAKECGGLPLALITIGRAMRKEKKINQWQIALSELQNSPESSEGMKIKSLHV